MIHTPSHPAPIDPPQCPLCQGGLDAARGFRVNQRRFLCCSVCGTFIASPPPDARDLSEFYSNEYFKQCGSCEGSGRRRGMLLQVLRRIPARPPGRLLDVGCGAGHFIALARENGWDVTGVDPSREACAFARREYGLSVHAAPLEAAPLPTAAFDVVTMLNVLDQAPHPLALLRAAAGCLRKDGLLVLRIPNGGFHRAGLSLLRLLPVSSQNSLRRLLIFHPLLFDAGAAQAVLTHAGFSQVRVVNAPISGTELGWPGGKVGRFALPVLIWLGQSFLRMGAAVAPQHFRWAPSLLVFAWKHVAC
jgi:SAM-dependent methyltransferase